jgi:hypothetical protein
MALQAATRAAMHVQSSSLLPWPNTPCQTLQVVTVAVEQATDGHVDLLVFETLAK